MKLGAVLARAALAILFIALVLHAGAPAALAAASLQAGAIPGPNPPTSESQACSSPNSGLGVSPGSIALFDVVACTMTLSGNNPGPVSDGNVIITLSGTDNALPGVVLSCAAPCLVQAGGAQLSAPCGNTAPAGTVPSATCAAITYTIASQLAACLNSPLNACSPRASVASVPTSATEQISFVATPGNRGASAVLGSDSVAFAGAGTGSLLVTASPASIPSNGTLASVITATFACTGAGLGAPGQLSQTANFVTGAGSPLSLPETTNTVVTDANGQLVLNGGCGAGLPGGFTFSAPRGVSFDNGRTTEGISCGLGPTVNSYGGGLAPSLPYRSTAPLAFTCTGAAVLAIGSGAAATSVPINVAYASAVGGLTAYGSALISVVPSPDVAQINLSCTPQTITAGGPGSVCTATVADPNGVPISGLTGATVQWTTSDSSRTIVEACPSGAVGAINPNSHPVVTPLVQAQQPCQLPTPTIPAFNSTIVNGQASALVVSPAGSTPGPISISAGLYTLVPPYTACEASPYLPQPLLPLTYSTGAPAVAGCGTAAAIGTTGFAASFPAQQAGFSGANTVGLPNITSAGTVVTIVSSSYISVASVAPGMPLQLSKGCNQVAITTPAGTPITTLAGLVSPASSVVSIWRFDNTSKLYEAGYFADPTAPADIVATGNIRTNVAPNGNGTIAHNGAGITESYFICVQAAGMIPST